MDNQLIASVSSVYRPVAARTGTGYLPSNLVCYNLGSGKGLGFDRVLVIPAENQLKFLAGDGQAFDMNKTGESRNKLYVAITRARFSLAFLVEDKKVNALPFRIWKLQTLAPHDKATRSCRDQSYRS